MEDFQALMTIIERLLAPGGCPWDQEQTLHSMRASLIEETYEVVEAIDLDDSVKIEEELGDLLFNVVFLCKLAEKDKRFTFEDAARHINAKLIRRHPHVFGEASVKDSEEVLKQWEAIKQTEKGSAHRTSALDGIPKDLPSLARAQKVLKKFQKAGFNWKEHVPASSQQESELGFALLSLVDKARQQGLEAENALRALLSQLEKQFREKE